MSEFGQCSLNFKEGIERGEGEWGVEVQRRERAWVRKEERKVAEGEEGSSEGRIIRGRRGAEGK